MYKGEAENRALIKLEEAELWEEVVELTKLSSGEKLHNEVAATTFVSKVENFLVDDNKTGVKRALIVGEDVAKRSKKRKLQKCRKNRHNGGPTRLHEKLNFDVWVSLERFDESFLGPSSESETAKNLRSSSEPTEQTDIDSDAVTIACSSYGPGNQNDIDNDNDARVIETVHHKNEKSSRVKGLYVECAKCVKSIISDYAKMESHAMYHLKKDCARKYYTCLHCPKKYLMKNHIYDHIQSAHKKLVICVEIDFKIVNGNYRKKALKNMWSECFPIPSEHCKTSAVPPKQRQKKYKRNRIIESSKLRDRYTDAKYKAEVQKMTTECFLNSLQMPQHNNSTDSTQVADKKRIKKSVTQCANVKRNKVISLLKCLLCSRYDCLDLNTMKYHLCSKHQQNNIVTSTLSRHYVVVEDDTQPTQVAEHITSSEHDSIEDSYDNQVSPSETNAAANNMPLSLPSFSSVPTSPTDTSNSLCLDVGVTEKSAADPCSIEETSSEKPDSTSINADHAYQTDKGGDKWCFNADAVSQKIRRVQALSNWTNPPTAAEISVPHSALCLCCLTKNFLKSRTPGQPSPINEVSSETTDLTIINADVDSTDKDCDEQCFDVDTVSPEIQPVPALSDWTYPPIAAEISVQSSSIGLQCPIRNVLEACALGQKRVSVVRAASSTVQLIVRPVIVKPLPQKLMQSLTEPTTATETRSNDIHPGVTPRSMLLPTTNCANVFRTINFHGNVLKVSTGKKLMQYNVGYNRQYRGHSHRNDFPSDATATTKVPSIIRRKYSNKKTTAAEQFDHIQLRPKRKNVDYNYKNLKKKHVKLTAQSNEKSKKTTHRGAEPALITCNKCKFPLRNVAEVKTFHCVYHLNHDEPKTDNYVCLLCQLKHADEMSLRVHVEHVHRTAAINGVNYERLTSEMSFNKMNHILFDNATTSNVISSRK